MRKLLLLAVASVAAVCAQPYALSPLPIQFFDNNGIPLAGGLLYSCAASTTCPGTPQATYTSSSGSTLLPNPIVLDASGRAFVFLNTTLFYKFVLTTSANVLVWSVDNVSAAAGGSSGPTTNYWTLNGSTISNNNGGGAGDVSTGANLNVAGDILLTGNLKLRDTNGSPNYANIRAANNMTQDMTWRWPATDAVGVLTSDGAGNLSFSPGGGGGGGTPGGANTNVQYNNNGAFAGSGNFTWNNGTQQLIVTSNNVAGIAVGNGYMQSDEGFLATSSVCVNYNCIQAPTAGVYANSLRAIHYTQVGNNSGTPTLTATDTFQPGAFYYDTGSHALKVFNDSSTWVTVATGGATSPGGANTNIQFNSAGSFGGSSNLTWNGAAQQLTVVGNNTAGIAVATAYIQSDEGFLVTPATGIQYNVIQAPSGGSFAKSHRSINYTQVGNSTGVPPLTSSDTFQPGALYYDLGLGALQVFNGTSWAGIGGGGSGSPVGPNTSVQFNNGGIFGGSANFEWNNALSQLVVRTNNIAGIAVGTGYIQSDEGFLATPSVCVSWNCIQAPTAGMGARSFTATSYVQTGRSSGAPAPTNGDVIVPGALYWDTSGSEMVFNGSTWQPLATGGVPSINTLTGPLTISGTLNQVMVQNNPGTIILSTPQDINTFSNVQFGSVRTGTITATNTGSSLTFQNSNSNFQVNGNGAVSASGVISSTGAAGGLNNVGNAATNSIQTVGGVNVGSTGSSNGSYSINGTQVINSLKQFIGTGVAVSGGVSGSGFNPTGGFVGQSWTITFPNAAAFTISGQSGTWKGLVFVGGVLVSANR